MAWRAARFAIGALLLAGVAAAQNGDGIPLGSEASLTGGAVLASARDPASAYYNPAGLALLPGSSVQISGTALQFSTLSFRSFLTTALPWGRVDQGAQSSELAAIPTVAAYGFRLSPRWGAAVGVWVPEQSSLGLVSTLHSSGSFVAGGGSFQVDYSQRIALTQNLQRTYFGAAAGFALRPDVRVGGAIFAIYQREDDFLDVFAGAVTNSPDPAQHGATVGASQRGATSRFGARASLGLQWDVTPALTVAGAVKTAALSLFSTGGVTTTSQIATLLPGAAPEVTFSEATTSPDRLIEPWLLALGSAVQVGSASLRAELDWQAPRAGRRGVLNGRLALREEASPDLAWGIGFFTDRSSERASAGALDVDYYGVAAGVDYRPSPVRAARGPSATWDVRTSLAVRYALGTGEAPLLQANPFSMAAALPLAGRVIAHTLAVTLGGTLCF